jgi:hypothetical protein
MRVRLNRQEVIVPVDGDDTLQNVFWAKSWKTELIERLLGPESGLFVDVGANLGQTLLDLWSINPNIPYLGFEPNLACICYLKELIQINYHSCRLS